MLKIKLTEDAIKDAKKFQVEINAYYDTINSPNYTQLSINDRWFVGYLGEWAFNKFLLSKGINCNWKPTVEVGSQGTDFIINNREFEIKTASSPNYQMLMIPKKQFDKYSSEYYVGLRLDLKNMLIEIHGYIKENELKEIAPREFGHGILTIAVELERLKDVTKLVELEYQTQLNKMEVKNIATLKEESKAYTPKVTLNIADLDKVLLTWPIELRTGTDKDGEKFNYKVMIANELEYRVPATVLEEIQKMLKLKPELEAVNVTKTGSGLQTKYSVNVAD